MLCMFILAIVWCLCGCLMGPDQDVVYLSGIKNVWFSKLFGCTPIWPFQSFWAHREDCSEQCWNINGCVLINIWCQMIWRRLEDDCVFWNVFKEGGIFDSSVSSFHWTDTRTETCNSTWIHLHHFSIRKYTHAFTWLGQLDSSEDQFLLGNHCH